MLHPSEQALLSVVLSITGDDEKQIDHGISKAMIGVKDKARRTHLRCVLKRAAKARIRAAKKKVRN